MAILNQPSVTASLTTLNSTLVFPNNATDGANTLSFAVTGTFVGTIVLEASIDGVNFFALNVRPLATPYIQVASVNAIGTNLAVVSGFKQLRIRMSAYTSGTAIISATTSTALIETIFAPKPSDLIVTNTGVSGAAVTLSLPSATGFFHHITNLSIERHASTLLTAGATPTLVTTTNLQGSLVFSIPVEAAAQGTVYLRTFEPCNPFRSTAVSTATTIVCPATTGVIWRVTALYYTAP